MVRNRNNNVVKTLKDYAVPFIGLFLILVLLYSVFSGGNEQNNIDTDNIPEYVNDGEIQISLDSIDSIAYIIYEGGKKVEIEDIVSLGKSEKISVEKGSVNIDFPFYAKMKLSKNGELSYKEDGTFYLESANLWVESMVNIEIFMKYANVSMGAGAIANLSQNEVESTIYSLDGKIDVSNLAGISANLNGGNKVSIGAKDSTSNDIDLEGVITIIDDYFKLSSWFIENGGNELLNNENDNTESGSLLGDGLIELEDSASLITFDNITDESYVNSNSLDLTGRYSPLKIGKITINNKEVILNEELGTFSLNGFNLVSSVNDLIIKIFDKNQNIISKKILTLYSNNAGSNTSTVSNIKANESLENYPVKATDFIIYEPTTTGKLTTKESRVTLRGKVTNENVKEVLVNDYSLQSYNGSTWRYHAFVEQGTLKDGANNYEIKYLDEDGKVIYKEYYSIYKELIDDVTPDLEKETGIISSEVKLN